MRYLMATVLAVAFLTAPAPAEAGCFGKVLRGVKGGVCKVLRRAAHPFRRS